MKKLSVLFAAAAMFAFVGCNKENASTYVADENVMVTLTMSGENWQNTSKQTYLDIVNRIAFDINDVAIINGVNANVIPCDVTGATTNPDETPVARSFYAQMQVDANVLTGTDYVIYPAGMFTAGTAADMSDYTVTMSATPMFIESDMNTMLDENYPAWPMAAKLSGHNFLLKNAVAIATPSIKYGAPFINALATMTDSPIANENVDVLTGYNFPELYIEEVELTSTDQVLAGLGHLENMDTDPILVMEATGTNTITIDCDEHQVMPTGNGEDLLGNITIAPFAAGKHLQMNVKFILYFPETDGEYEFVYTGSSIEMTDTPNTNRILRSKRSTLCVNLFQADAINKVALVD